MIEGRMQESEKVERVDEEDYRTKFLGCYCEEGDRNQEELFKLIGMFWREFTMLAWRK